jgi:hypothetical protein
VTLGRPTLGFDDHRHRRWVGRLLAVVAVAQLLGLWLERYLLVVPSFEGARPLGIPQVLVAMGVLGAFVLAIGGALESKLEEANPVSERSGHKPTAAEPASV